MTLSYIEKLKILFHKVGAANLLVFNLFLLCVVFQIYLITKLTLLYPVLKVLFLTLLTLLLFSLAKLPKKEKVFILLCILLIVAIRLPFYLHSTGLISSSDNALEALQSDEIRDSHAAPLYLLNSSGHNGTLKYLLTAFVWDFLGRSYLYVVLVQLLIFLCFLYIVYKVFENLVDRKILLLILLSNLAFIELFFDYSLFLRAAPYLEMLMFFLLGVYFFDFEFKNKRRLFLSYYFALFAIYLHPIALFLVVPFTLCACLYAFSRHQFLNNAGLLLAGFFSGGFHLLYFRFFGSPLPNTGEWYAKKFLSLKPLSIGRFFHIAAESFKDFKVIFTNILNFEFFYSSTVTFPEKTLLKPALILVNRLLVYFSFVVFFLAVILVIKKIFNLKNRRLESKDWSPIFYLLLLLTILGKIFILSPKPFYEPRHNIDLAFLLVMSYLLVFSEFLKLRKFPSFKGMFILILMLLVAFPHYHSFLKGALVKEKSYSELLSVLVQKRVKYLTTDFVIAYVVYFLSNRVIQSSDSLGPVTVRFFYPKLRQKVDEIPWNQKAYLFFSDESPSREWHMHHTNVLRITLLRHLSKSHIPFKIFNIKDYTLIIPATAKTYD